MNISIVKNISEAAISPLYPNIGDEVLAWSLMDFIDHFYI